MQVADLNEAIVGAYLRCSTYRDRGSVTSRLTDRSTGRPSTTMLTFRTAFVRPHRFRFEFREVALVESEGTRYIVHADEQGFSSWWDLDPQVERHESLLSSLAGPTGISKGTALTVPALLIADTLPKRIGLFWRNEAYSVESDVLVGKSCFRVQCELAARTPTREDGEIAINRLVYWIDSSTHLLLRIQEDCEYDTFTSHSVTEYSPEVGEPLSNEELAFGVGNGPA